MLVTLSLFAGLAEPAAAEGVDTVAAEQEFVGHINFLRASQGLGALSVDPALTQIARDWAGQMAGAGGISHRPNLADVAPSNWLKVGENVGVGPNVAGLHHAFVQSPGHYKNLVDPDFTTVGIGIVMVGDTMYVTENFMKTSGSAPQLAASGAPSFDAGAGAAAAAAPAAAGTVKVCKGKGKARKCKLVKKSVKKAAKKKVARKAARRK
jgi:hypothetical protein